MTEVLTDAEGRFRWGCSRKAGRLRLQLRCIGQNSSPGVSGALALGGGGCRSVWLCPPPPNETQLPLLWTTFPVPPRTATFHSPCLCSPISLILPRHTDPNPITRLPLQHALRSIVQLPIHPRLGKMMVLGSVFGCLTPLVVIAGAMSVKDPFVVPQERREESDAARQQFSGGHASDHVTMFNAFCGWLEASRWGNERAFCDANFLSRHSMNVITHVRDQLLQLLYEQGFGCGSPGTPSIRTDVSPQSNIQNMPNNKGSQHHAFQKFNSDFLRVQLQGVCFRVCYRGSTSALRIFWGPCPTHDHFRLPPCFASPRIHTKQSIQFVAFHAILHFGGTFVTLLMDQGPFGLMRASQPPRKMRERMR